MDDMTILALAPRTAIRNRTARSFRSASNDQLTDGGPSVTPELPGGVAGPPFGGALGWAVSWP